jgi:hypothetical protein
VSFLSSSPLFPPHPSTPTFPTALGLCLAGDYRRFLSGER